MIKGKRSRPVCRVRLRCSGFFVGLCFLGLCLTADVASQGNPQPVLRARIEIPAGSMVKYEIDAETGEFAVVRFLAAHLRYPANYGFLPGLRSSDGDALDVLVITRVPLVPGAALFVRPVGVLRMTDHGAEDHKLISVPVASVDPWFEGVEDIDDLPVAQRQGITTFFSTYKRTPAGSNPVVLLGMEGREIALKTLQAAGLGRQQKAHSAQDPANDH